ncbi:MAG TPA: hypothetical protein VKD90_30795 [Gemmataceae bacterium]|nr:hypothetical protein [Gemmataceae bacterium]
MPEPRTKVDVPFESDAEIDEFVRLFELCELPYERWTHRAHLAVAASYLTRYALSEATDRARAGIQRYNRTRGDPAGYHETITVVFMRLVARELTADGRGIAGLVNELAGRCPVTWLYQYFSPKRLWSAEARAGLVAPDLRPLDF